ncbi:MAG: L-histidine N(alpha)-methyltransferase [Bacteroidetes bacterium]|nr:L-histidine N(alpha)-methyltransferase [Bacteroidota bacterium]MDA1120272.1 L-histidine N(alpha)-methyltransferase [Bacteroidota bacterium]
MSKLLQDNTETIELNSSVHSLPDQEFARDVTRGLSANRKYLSSKYFYDEKGDELFQQIMELDEYYLTRSEYSIFDKNKERILETFCADCKGFNLLEFGAGDGYKTKVLLRHFAEQNTNFHYSPIDISANSLEQLTNTLEIELPKLKVSGLRGEYFQVLEGLKSNQEERRIVLFLGSNIGNFTKQIAIQFLDQLHSALNPGDLVMIGFDLKKDPSKILGAYSDKSGVTSAFNLNLLSRINRELGGNFNLNNFIHSPYYDPVSGECRSYLISTIEQTVHIDDLNMQAHFKAWEAIHMEISTKFDLDGTDELATTTGFKIEANFFDDKKWFVDSVWSVK